MSNDELVSLKGGMVVPDRNLGSNEPLAWGRAFWVVVALVSFALITLWTFIPWQWSPVDDPGQVLTMNGLLAQHGTFGGILERIGQLASGDKDGGVFRPLAWIYPPAIYVLPAQAAHVVRLLMVIIIILGPLVYFRRRGARPPLLAMILGLLLISAGTLYQGLLLLSIQEVGGMTLVSLGLMTNQRTLRLALWVMSALFKGPFLWILFGNAIVLWREGRRRLAAASAAAGVSLLVISLWWAQLGSYTGRYRIAPLEEYQWINASRLLEQVNGAILIAVLWWIVVTQARLVRQTDFPIFAVAAVGYFVQMIPWGFTGYYMGPISFFLGLLLASVLTNGGTLSTWTIITGLALPILIAGWVMLVSLGFVFRTNSLMQQGSDCLAQTANARIEIIGGWLYLASSEEGPLRLAQNTQLFYPGWQGELALDSTMDGEQRDANTSHVLLLPGETLPTGESADTICVSKYVTLAKLN